MTEIVLIGHNLRSSHNVGSLLRTADGLGVSQVFLTGYTPYPLQPADVRLPHLAQRIDKQISKTALGAERSLGIHQEDVEALIAALTSEGYTIAGLEQSPNSHDIRSYKPPKRIALILGREVDGIEPELLSKCDVVLEIPMRGKKESFNVAQAAAIAMFQLSA